MRQSAETKTGFAFISPVLIHFAVFFWIPLIFILLLSFGQWDMFGTPKFVGIENYKELFSDRFFVKSLLISVTYALSTTVLLTFLGMAFAFLFDRPGPIAAMARILFFMTAIMPLISAAAIWVWITGPEGYSGLNLVLRFFGFSPLRWQADPQLALGTVIGFSIWKNVGFNILIFTAGLRGIPAVYQDAAKVDGANWLQRILFITIPMLKPTTLFLVVINMINGWNVFTPVWFLTHGGPGTATRILTTHIYHYGFGQFKYGYASAASVVLVGIVLVFTYFRLRGVKNE